MLAALVGRLHAVRVRRRIQFVGVHREAKPRVVEGGAAKPGPRRLVRIPVVGVPKLTRSGVGAVSTLDEALLITRPLQRVNTSACLAYAYRYLR